MDTAQAESTGEHESSSHHNTFTVFVNEHPVTLDQRVQTGMSIKQAAIAQHVEIRPDFVLSIERGGGRTELVGDDQEIRVHANERFLAIPNDDNS